MTIKKCAACGKEFEAKRHTHKYCSTKCKNHKNAEAYRKLHHVKQRQEKKKEPNPFLTIREVVRLAAAEGVSYGQYVLDHCRDNCHDK